MKLDELIMSVSFLFISIAALVMMLGLFADEIVKIVREIRRKY